MTVAELIESLFELPQDAIVLITNFSSWDDDWFTEVDKPIYCEAEHQVRFPVGAEYEVKKPKLGEV